MIEFADLERLYRPASDWQPGTEGEAAMLDLYERTADEITARLQGRTFQVPVRLRRWAERNLDGCVDAVRVCLVEQITIAGLVARQYRRLFTPSPNMRPRPSLDFVVALGRARKAAEPQEIEKDAKRWRSFMATGKLPRDRRRGIHDRLLELRLSRLARYTFLGARAYLTEHGVQDADGIARDALWYAGLQEARFAESEAEQLALVQRIGERTGRPPTATDAAVAEVMECERFLVENWSKLQRSGSAVDQLAVSTAGLAGKENLSDEQLRRLRRSVVSEGSTPRTVAVQLMSTVHEAQGGPSLARSCERWRSATCEPNKIALVLAHIGQR